MRADFPNYPVFQITPRYPNYAEENHLGASPVSELGDCSAFSVKRAACVAIDRRTVERVTIVWNDRHAGTEAECPIPRVISANDPLLPKNSVI